MGRSILRWRSKTGTDCSVHGGEGEGRCWLQSRKKKRIFLPVEGRIASHSRSKLLLKVGPGGVRYGRGEGGLRQKPRLKGLIRVLMFCNEL